MGEHGTICWNELNTWQPHKAMAYYSAVLGWTFDDAETAGTLDNRAYFVAKKDGVPVAGIFTMIKPMFEGVPEHWFTYIAVDDLAAAMAASNTAGGKVCRDPFDIPGFGRLAIVSDANGAFMGLLQPLATAER